MAQMVHMLGYLPFALCVVTRNWKILKNFQDFQKLEKSLKNSPGPEIFQIGSGYFFPGISKTFRTGPARPGPGFPGIPGKAKTRIFRPRMIWIPTPSSPEFQEFRKPKVRGKDFLPSGRRPYTFLSQTRFWRPVHPKGGSPFPVLILKLTALLWFLLLRTFKSRKHLIVAFFWTSGSQQGRSVLR